MAYATRLPRNSARSWDYWQTFPDLRRYRPIERTPDPDYFGQLLPGTSGWRPFEAEHDEEVARLEYQLYGDPNDPQDESS